MKKYINALVVLLWCAYLSYININEIIIGLSIITMILLFIMFELIDIKKNNETLTLFLGCFFCFISIKYYL